MSVFKLYLAIPTGIPKTDYPKPSKGYAGT